MRYGSATLKAISPHISALQSPFSISTFATFNVKSDEATLLLMPCMLLR